MHFTIISIFQSKAKTPTPALASAFPCSSQTRVSSSHFALSIITTFSLHLSLPSPTSCALRPSLEILLPLSVSLVSRTSSIPKAIVTGFSARVRGLFDPQSPVLKQHSSVHLFSRLSGS